MKIEASSPEEYLSQLPPDRKEAMTKLRKEMISNLPAGFQERMSYGMIGYVVPHSIFPKGYHCDPKLPLPFVNIANQKNFVAVYHMGIYADSKLLEWFRKEYPKHTDAKLDMGKSCIRFTKPEKIPFKLFGELMSKMSVKDWINVYESNFEDTPENRAKRTALRGESVAKNAAKKAVKKTAVKKPVKKNAPKKAVKKSLKKK
ncbi:MAG: hypothetical protein K0Q95_1291 [Bacteroidota bacterium]|jgi:uncharacterized protein YdhG (YjbR/CyaY superfamily)|nr:hypothetical protein [Bacteroidota bacterium]